MMLLLLLDTKKFGSFAGIKVGFSEPKNKKTDSSACWGCDAS